MTINTITGNDHNNPMRSRMIAMMEENRKRILKLLQSVTEEMIDYTPSTQEIESIGTLLDHIAAVEWSWIFEDIDKLEMDYEEWKYAFALREQSEVNQQVGKGRKFYIEKITKTREQVIQRLEQMNDHDLTQVIDTGENKKFTVEWILFHLINHEALHLGQISLLKRLYHINVASQDDKSQLHSFTREQQEQP